MIRYVVSFPAGARLNQQFVQRLQEELNGVANEREWRDLIITEGGTITDMRALARETGLRRLALRRAARSRVR